MSIGRWVGSGGLIGAVCGALVGVFVVKEPPTAPLGWAVVGALVGFIVGFVLWELYGFRRRRRKYIEPKLDRDDLRRWCETREVEGDHWV